MQFKNVWHINSKKQRKVKQENGRKPTILMKLILISIGRSDARKPRILIAGLSFALEDTNLFRPLISPYGRVKVKQPKQQTV